MEENNVSNSHPHEEEELDWRQRSREIARQSAIDSLRSYRAESHQMTLLLDHTESRFAPSRAEYEKSEAAIKKMKNTLQELEDNLLECEWKQRSRAIQK